ncbi:MAG TPA: flagellar biosynthetic protein FliR [Phycisphaerales bacterium]|nr:flagellar biosynthetic protein FliR [Phycisphaerales bacterium]
MPSLDQHIEPFLLVLARLGGLFIFAPMLGSTAVPVRARALLALALAAALYPLVRVAGTPAGSTLPATPGLAALGLVMGFEVLIGLAVGLLAAIPIYAVQLGGHLMGQQIGLGLAGVYNPALETESDALGELMLYLAIAAFIALGGLENLFFALARTFEGLPPGAAAGLAPPLDLALALLSSGFELALRVAAPVLGILMLETIATGFLMKTIPQINILSIGFAIKIVLGLAALIAGLAVVREAAGEELLAAGRELLSWASGPLTE